MEVIFEIVESGKSRYFKLPKDGVVIGRDEKISDIKISEDGASKKHCHIKYKNGRLVVIDLNSKNGTHINGEKVSVHPVYADDCIQIGECYIRMATKRMKLPVVQSLRNPSCTKFRGKSISIVKSQVKRHHGANDLTLGNLSTVNLKNKINDKKKNMKGIKRRKISA